MKHRTMLAILGAVIFCAMSCGAGHPENDLRVIALGNEGFLVEAGGFAVMVDGLYDGLSGYVEPTDEQRRARERAEPPFDVVDLVLVTHHHPDHFDARVVCDFLTANRRAIFVSTPMAEDYLRDEGDQFSSISERVRSVYPEEGEREFLEIDGIGIEVLNLHHGRDRSQPTENLGFVVEMKGVVFLHMGDTLATADELEALDLSERRIDIAFVPYWHLQEEAGARSYLEAIGATTVVAMHLPTADAPPSYLDPASNLQELVRMVKAAAPGVLIFTDVMEEKEIRTGD